MATLVVDDLRHFLQHERQAGIAAVLLKLTALKETFAINVIIKVLRGKSSFI
jgi:hypothetical protein